MRLVAKVAVRVDPAIGGLPSYQLLPGQSSHTRLRGSLSIIVNYKAGPTIARKKQLNMHVSMYGFL